MPLVRRCPSKSTWMPFPLCNKCPPRTLDHISTRPSLGKTCQWPTSQLTLGAHTHISRPTLPIKRHTNAPPSPMHSALSQLIEEPSNPKASMLPRKNVSMANVMAHPRGSPMLPTRCCPLKGTWMSLPPCNECPSCVLSPILARRQALESSREHVASKKNVNGQHRASPQGSSPMPLVRCCSSKGTRMSLPHMQ